MVERRKNATIPVKTKAPVPSVEAPKESAVVRLLLTPLSVISFLLSLAIISERNLAMRTTSHEAYPNTLLGRFRALLHFLLFKRVDRSPYAYVRSPNEVQVKGKEKEREKEPWHWHSNQRHMMKVEMDDAFRVRKWVLLSLGILLSLLLGGVGWSCWWLSGYMYRGTVKR